MSIEEQLNFIMKMYEEQKVFKKDIRELKSLRRDVVDLSNRMFVMERSAEKQLSEMDASYWANKIRKLEDKVLEFEKQMGMMNESLTLLSQKEPVNLRAIKPRASIKKKCSLNNEIKNLQKILAYLESHSVDPNLFVNTLKQAIKEMITTLNTMVNGSIGTVSSFHFSTLLQYAVTMYGRDKKHSE